MRDWIADWNKWSGAERVLALLVTLGLVALPLGVLLTGKGGGLDPFFHKFALCA